MVIEKDHIYPYATTLSNRSILVPFLLPHSDLLSKNTEKPSFFNFAVLLAQHVGMAMQ